MFSGGIVIDFVYLCSRWTNDLSVYGRLLSHVSTFISSERLHTSLSNLYRFICILSEDVFFCYYFTLFSLLHSLLSPSKPYYREINKLFIYPLNYIPYMAIQSLIISNRSNSSPSPKQQRHLEEREMLDQFKYFLN